MYAYRSVDGWSMTNEISMQKLTVQNDLLVYILLGIGKWQPVKDSPFVSLLSRDQFSFGPNKSSEEGQRWQDYSPTTPLLPQCLPPGTQTCCVCSRLSHALSFSFYKSNPQGFRAQKTVFILLLTPFM